MNIESMPAERVLLVRAPSGGEELRGRAEFRSDKAFTKYLLKQLKSKDDPAKKKEDDKKKGKTFTYWEVAFILMATSFPVATIQLGFGYALFKIVKTLASGQ